MARARRESFVISLVLLFSGFGRELVQKRGDFLLFRQEFCISSERFIFLEHIVPIVFFELAREAGIFSNDFESA